MVFKKSRPETILVALDIGTVNIRALIVRLKNQKLEIIGLGQASQAENDMQAGAIADIPAVSQNCSKALSQAESQAGVRATLAVLGIAGDLIKGITNTSRIERPQPSQPLTVAEINQIIAQTQVAGAQQARQEIMAEIGGQNIDIKLINTALVNTVVDSYKVTNPIGFQGRNLEMQLYTAFAPLVHTGAIERVARDLGLNLVAIAAEPFAIARSLVGDHHQSALNAILIDIGGGTTDIAILRDGGVEATRSFAIGGCAFSYAIARELGVDYDQAENLKLNFSSGRGSKLKTEVRSQIKSALEKTLDVWLAGVNMSLSEFSWLEYLPSQVWLSGGGSLLPLLPDSLKRSPWRKGLPFSKEPQVATINPQKIPDIINQTGQVIDHLMTTALGLVRVADDTIQTDSHNHQAQSLIRQKLSQTLTN